MRVRNGRRHVLIVVACLALIAGCIDAKRSSFLRYDKQTDTFSLIDVWVNIATKEESELDHIASMWQRRDNLITAHPLEFALFASPTIYERKGKHSYTVFPIATKPEKEPEAVTTPVDLDTIRVIPGSFFLNEQRNLCYYHEVVVPGSTIDALLRETSPVLAEWLAQFAESQIQAAGKPDAQKPTWNDMRESMLESLGEKPPKPAEEGKKGEKLAPFEPASLRLLIKAGVDRSVPLSREGEVFTLVVPLSKRDCDEIVATVDLARQVVADRLKTGKKVEKGVAEFLEAVEVSHVAGSGLQVKVNVSKLLNLGGSDINALPDPEKKLLYLTTAAAVQGRGVEVIKTNPLPELLKRYGVK
jgi:hypothetical protein